MNSGAYASQDKDKLTAKVEELIRADLGLEGALNPRVVEGEASGISVGSLLSDVAKGFFGGNEKLLMTICFDLKQPRVVALQVRLNRQGVGAHLGSSFYSTLLSKPVTGEVTLDEPKTFGSSKFVGDAAVCEKLNANKDLVKRANKFARTECPNFHITAPRLFKIQQEDGKAALIAATLPRSYAMGFKISLDVKEFTELAGLIEATL